MARTELIECDICEGPVEGVDYDGHTIKIPVVVAHQTLRLEVSIGLIKPRSNGGWAHDVCSKCIEEAGDALILQLQGVTFKQMRERRRAEVELFRKTQGLKGDA